MNAMAQKLDYWKVFAMSKYVGYRERRLFDSVSSYCMFIGYPKSGHSLVGQLVNAHRNAVIAHELNALWYLENGFSRNQIFSLLIQRDRKFTQRGSRWGGYHYKVPNQWQGKYESIMVIGDKKGGGSSKILADHPDLLLGLRQRVEVPLRLIHVMRNPYDNISTMSRLTGHRLERSIKQYFRLCETVSKIISRLKDSELYSLRHEDLIAQPERHLEGLCDFLGLNRYAGYIEDCAGIIFKSPTNTRHKMNWPGDLRAAVQERIQSFAFLDGYSFDS